MTLKLATAVLASLLPATAVAEPEASCVALTRGFWAEVFQKRNADVAINYLAPTCIQHVAAPQPLIKEWVDVWRGVFSVPPIGSGKDFAEAQSVYSIGIRMTPIRQLASDL